MPGTAAGSTAASRAALAETVLSQRRADNGVDAVSAQLCRFVDVGGLSRIWWMRTVGLWCCSNEDCPRGPGHPPQFRQRAIELVEGGRRVAEVAADLGVRARTVYTWRRHARSDLGLAAGPFTGRRAELTAGERRIRDLEIEVGIHRRAAERLRERTDGCGDAGLGWQRIRCAIWTGRSSARRGTLRWCRRLVGDRITLIAGILIDGVDVGAPDRIESDLIDEYRDSDAVFRQPAAALVGDVGEGGVTAGAEADQLHQKDWRRRYQPVGGCVGGPVRGCWFDGAARGPRDLSLDRR